MSKQTTHELKTMTPYFEAQLMQMKRFEVRALDRDYKLGDTLVLREWTGTRYTGAKLSVDVTFMLTAKEFDGLQEGFAILGTGKPYEVKR